jgi:hypothetical protein
MGMNGEKNMSTTLQWTPVKVKSKAEHERKKTENMYYSITV